MSFFLTTHPVRPKCVNSIKYLHVVLVMSWAQVAMVLKR